MGKARLCLLWPLAGLFGCSLMWIYWQSDYVEGPIRTEVLFWPNITGEVKIPEIEREPNTTTTQDTPLVQPTESDWDLFLLRRGIPLPSLTSSLQLWTSPAESTHPAASTPLVEHPDLKDSRNVTCSLTKFGFTKAQADAVYNPNKRLRRCSDQPQTHFISVQDNILTVDCGQLRGSEYVIGQSPSEELLGDVDFPKGWSAFTTPQNLGESEFAFARCGRTRREALLINKFNPEVAEKVNSTVEKLQKALNDTKPIRPLAVYILMFDSVARLHFYRNFPETVKFLNQTVQEGYLGQEFGIYDFAINNGHGENTQPNMVPFLYGYDIKYHKSRLYDFSIHRTSDRWKYHEIQQEVLWSHYKKLGFVTYFGYDTVWDSFSHSFGRVIETDHMVSNFFHAARKLAGYTDFLDKERCIGSQNVHNFPLMYLNQFHNNYKGYNRFAYQHLSPGHDKGGTVIKTADTDTKAFLEKLMTDSLKNRDEDVVIFLASDHGKHSSEWDKTYEGFLENQLPVHIAIMNQNLIARLQAEDILLHNTKRLVSRLDWHVTLRHLATVPYGRLNATSPLYKAWKLRTDSPSSISLFLEKVPDDRDCEDVSIPLHYCSCKEFQEIPQSQAIRMPVVLTIAQMGISYINSLIKRDSASDICSYLTIAEILKAAYQLSNNDPSSISRSFKLRVSVKESEKAKFDIVGMMVPAEEGYKLAEEAIGSLFVTKDGEERKVWVALKEVFRVDAYEGICEEMARAVPTQAAFCVCHLPFPESGLTPTQITVAEKLFARLQLALAVKGRNCHLTCIDLDRSCHPWAMEILNDQRLLMKEWEPEGSGFEYLNMATRAMGKTKDLGITEWATEGRVVKLRSKGNGWMGILADWRKGPSCDDQPKADFAICPCN